MLLATKVEFRIEKLLALMLPKDEHTYDYDMQSLAYTGRSDVTITFRTLETDKYYTMVLPVLVLTNELEYKKRFNELLAPLTVQTAIDEYTATLEAANELLKSRMDALAGAPE